MMPELGLLALGWAPLGVIALLLRREIRFGHVLFGAALAGFVGGMCSVELRRHGLQAALPESWSLPILGLHPVDFLRFAFFGAAGALLGEILLTRSGDSPQGPAQDD
jgi:hypothetical protein